MSKQLQVNNFDPHDSKNIDKLRPGSPVEAHSRTRNDSEKGPSTYRIEKPCTNEQESGRRRRKRKGASSLIKMSTKHCRGCRLGSRSTDYVSQSWETTEAGIRAGPQYNRCWPAAATCEVLGYLASCSPFLCSVLPCAIPICFFTALLWMRQWFSIH